jgi:hypothetical protein
MNNEVKSNRSSIVQLSPLWRIRLIEEANKTPPEDIEDIEVRVSELCRQHAARLCQTIDISGMDSNWAESYFASHIANLIADKWAESREDAQSFPYDKHLASIASEPMYAGLPSTWHGTSAEVGYVATTLTSISKAMEAYSKFNLFHFNQDEIQGFMTEQIITAASEATFKITSQLSEQPDGNSSASLYQTLLRQAGIALSSLWESASVDLISVYKMANVEQREELQTPYDLELIATQLKKSMDSLVFAATKSLTVANQMKSNSEMSLG